MGSAVSLWIRWQDGAVFGLAKGISSAGKADDFPILADALEDAGCTDVALLTHCRYVGQHFRASWVVDLLLLAGRAEEQKVESAR